MGNTQSLKCCLKGEEKEGIIEQRMQAYYDEDSSDYEPYTLSEDFDLDLEHDGGSLRDFQGKIPPSNIKPLTALAILQERNEIVV